MTTQFTSREQIERLFSEDAVALRIDDAGNSGAEDDIMDDVINDATDIVWQFLWEQYREADCAASNWVKTRATWIAAYILSSRRGNPSQFIDRYQNILEELQAVHSRVRFVPGLQVLVTNQPTLANYVVDNRGLGPVARVLHDSAETWPGQRTTTSNPYPEII